MKTKKSASDVGNAETNFYQNKYMKSFKISTTYLTLKRLMRMLHASTIGKLVVSKLTHPP